MTYQPIIGMEVACRTEYQKQNVLRLQRRLFWCAAQYPRLPGLPGHARHVAGHQPAGGGVHDYDWPGLEWRDSTAQRFCPQKLLLPRPAQRLSDFSI